MINQWQKILWPIDYSSMSLITHRCHCVVPENIHTPPVEGFLSCTPPLPPWNSSLASYMYFSSKSLAFRTPLPLGISKTFRGANMDTFWNHRLIIHWCYWLLIDYLLITHWLLIFYHLAQLLQLIMNFHIFLYYNYLSSHKSSSWTVIVKNFLFVNIQFQSGL